MLKQKSLSEMKNTMEENGLLLESNVLGQNKPVSKTVSGKDALMADREMKIISSTEIISSFLFTSPLMLLLLYSSMDGWSSG